MKIMKSLFLVTILFANACLFSQQTVGLFSNTPESYNGYTMFSPMTSTTTYLIDNCGEKVHSWNSSKKPGLSSYILEDGTLLRTKNLTNSNFEAGGSGGGIEMLDWNSNEIWDYTISTSTECQHHDIEYLPNGNILAIVWDSKTYAEATQAGRTTSGSTLWSEKIIEIQPDLTNGGGIIVWEWKVWDHMVQDVDNAVDNYGVVSESPELININYILGNPNDEDWIHINSIDYNEELDQILLSCHNFSEVWIIDHSTTTSEASGHSGGIFNKGGDLLYRWGNPQAYDQGLGSDQLLFRQHDAYWIENTFTDGGMIMVFNNMAGTPEDYSEVNIIDPPVDDEGNYVYSGESYLPSGFHWAYEAPVPTDFFGSNISGARRLPNGNTLICEGPTGRFFEVDYLGTIVWEYVNPDGKSGIIEQGDPVNQNFVFRCTRYPVDYAGFNGQALVQQGYIESGSIFTCDLYPLAINDNEIEGIVSIFPNPAQNIITILSNENTISIAVYNSGGKKILSKLSNYNVDTINTSVLPDGVYFIEIISASGIITSEKIIIAK
jgi:arylsulfotransferase ASST/type IX secretion system substrate protein